MSPKITYDDFEIEIRSIGKARFEARVLKSPPGGRPGDRFVPPYKAGQLEDLLAAVERGVLVSSRAGRDLGLEDSGPGSVEPVVVEEMGRKLFRSLFPREVERCFHESMGRVLGQGEEQCGRGLRLRVTFDRSEDFARLATVPWEFLWNGEQFFNRRRLTPVVRSLNVPEPRVSGVIDSPLRVVLIPSNPRGERSLKTEYEARLVTEVLDRNPGIEAVTAGGRAGACRWRNILSKWCGGASFERRAQAQTLRGLLRPAEEGAGA